MLQESFKAKVKFNNVVCYFFNGIMQHVDILCQKRKNSKLVCFLLSVTMYELINSIEMVKSEGNVMPTHITHALFCYFSR